MIDSFARGKVGSGAASAAYILSLLIFPTAASAGDGGFSVHVGAGASRVTGELFEDTSYRGIYGLDLMYAVTGRISLGLHAGHTEWTPDIAPALPGASRIVEGSAGCTEIMAVVRFDMPWDRSERLTLFGEAGVGYCLLDSDVDVYSRPVVPDPGPYEFLYSIESQDRPCLNAGLGLAYRITGRTGVELLADYNYLFTDDDPLKYYSIGGGLVVRIF